ncbi:MAG: PTS sugar transporter subunit IIC [Enterobacteriaceae bacterium]
MSKALDFFQDKVAGKLIAFGENTIMQSIRNGMMLTIPFTIIGSIFIILRSFPVQAWSDFVDPYGALIEVGYNLTFGMLAIIAAIGVSYNLARFLHTNQLNAALITLISFCILQIDPAKEYALSTANFGASGIFTAMLVAILIPYLLHFCEKQKFVIRLPAGVPTYVSDSFVSLIPATVAILLMWVIRVFLDFDVNHLVQMLFSPLIVGLNTLPGILIFIFVTLLLWVCGLNGDSILSGIYIPVTMELLARNTAAFMAGEPIPNITAYGFFYFGMWMGGTGGTIALVLLMIRSRSQTYRSLSKICVPAGTFCINEPLVFGFPIMFNPIMAVPYIGTPLILMTATYFLMDMNLIGRPVVMIPWTTPPLINAYLCTAGDLRAVLWQVIEIVIAVFIYLPFFRAADRAKVLEGRMAAEQEAV